MNPWDEVLTNLSRKIPEKTYQRFFLGSQFISLEEGIITIRVPYRSFIWASLFHENAIQEALNDAGYSDLVLVVEN